MVKELLEGKLGLAPIGDTPQKILDLGTGCGIWAIEGESLAQTFSHLPLLPSLLAFFLFLFSFFPNRCKPSNDVPAGDHFPSAHVIGVDLSPIQQYYAPPNVEWKIDDLEAEWPALYHNADYIHAWSFLPTLSNPEKLLRAARQ